MGYAHGEDGKAILIMRWLGTSQVSTTPTIMKDAWFLQCGQINILQKMKGSNINSRFLSFKPLGINLKDNTLKGQNIYPFA